MSILLHPRITVPACVALSMLTSCITTKRASSDLAMPAHWQSQNSKAGKLNTSALTRWWSRFQ